MHSTPYSTERIVYLDYNATTPHAPEVAAAMEPLLRGSFGNPSSSHRLGREARDLVESSRSKVARMLGCKPEEVVFTSGGTEANNMAILGTAFAMRNRGKHIVTCAVEHPAVLEVCRFLEGQGYDTTVVRVDRFGMVDPGAIEAAIRPDTILVTVMHANNEVGTIQPVAEIADIAHRHGALFHCDGAQSVGKIPTRVKEMGVDLFSIAAHKFYGPKGIGALYVREGIELAKITHGAGQEGGRRPGTENVLEIVGLGKAAELAAERLQERAAHMRAMRNRLERQILSKVPWAVVNGHPESRLPNTLSISFPGLEAGKIISEMPEIACSAGAACHTAEPRVSHVLAAMGIEPRKALGTLRLSVGEHTTPDEVDFAAERIASAVTSLSTGRQSSP